MKKLAVAIAAAFALSGVAITASAQSHGSHSGGGWHGGGSHAQGGGSWHGGGDWHGGGWQGGRHGFWGPRIGFSFGFPAYSYWGPGYYPYAYGYPYPYAYSYDDGYGYDSTPQVYIQRDTGDAVAPAPARSPEYSSRPPEYSYYCTDPAGYYPQISNCPRGWLKVVPNNGGPRAPR